MRNYALNVSPVLDTHFSNNSDYSPLVFLPDNTWSCVLSESLVILWLHTKGILCIHVCAHACVCVCMCCTHAWRSILRVFYFSPDYFVRQGFSLFCLDWLASEPQDLSASALPLLGLQPKFYVGAKDPDSVLHASLRAS